MGLLDMLGGNRAQMPGQSRGGFGQLLSPEVALPMAAALMGNQGNMQNFGNAFGQAGPALAQTRDNNKTYQWLQQNAPEYAQLMDGGADGQSVLALYAKNRFAQTEDRDPFKAVGGHIFNTDTQEWMAPPGGDGEAPKVVELFDEATGQPYKATWNPETGGYERVGGIKARSGMQLQTNPDGTVTLTEGSIGGMPKLTEAEGRSSGFYGRGVKSHEVLTGLESEGTSIWNKTAGNIPIAGNYMRTQDAQRYDQAKRDFINAVLRRESGAVISEQEFANAEQQYFPQPGDGPDVIAQKRRNRETTIQGLKISAGQGANFAVQPPSGQPQRFRFNPETGELE
jgi:hypothetical protein